MGVNNINIIIHDPATKPGQISDFTIREATLVEAHKQGHHPYGEKRRDCPLCQMGK